MPAAPSPTSASRTGGPRTCRSRKGQWNFDEIRFVYFRDRVPAFEAFKAGQLDFWRESSAKGWATGYRFRCRQARAGEEERLPIDQRGAMRRLPSTLAGRSSRTRACAAPSISRSTSSGPTRTCSTTSTCASAATSTTPS